MMDPNNHAADVAEEFTAEEQQRMADALPHLLAQVHNELRRICGGKPVPVSLHTWAGGRAQIASNVSDRAVMVRGLRGMADLFEEELGLFEPKQERMN